MSLLEDYREEVKGQPTLGYLLWWTIRDVSIEESKLNDLYVKTGLADYMPKHVSNRKSFWRALKKFGKTHPDLLIRKIGENDQKIVYGIVAEDQNFTKEDLEYQIECKIVFWKETGSIAFSDDKHPAVQEMQLQYEKYCTHFIADDLRKAILSSIESLSSLDVRKQGGIYFVPVEFYETVAKFDELVSNLSSSAVMYTNPIPDLPRVRKKMFRAFMEQAEVELKEAAEELEKLRNDKGVRSSTIEARINRFKEFRDKATLYADLFKGKVEKIEERISSLEKVAQEVLLSLSEVA